MAAGEFRIFISAVTSEFGKARDALAADLRSRDTLVRVQSDFRQETGSDTTLKKLHDYIRDCSAVVAVIGGRSGACPPPAASAPFGKMLPSGISEASYTQWEFFFARHYRRRLSIYIADDNYLPDQPMPTGGNRPDLQQTLVRHIVEEKGLDRSYFSNVDQLCRAVLKEDWPRKPPVKPILLPYPSLGSLFKGRATFMRQLRNSLARTAAGRAAIVSQALYGSMGWVVLARRARRSNTPGRTRRSTARSFSSSPTLQKLYAVISQHSPVRSCSRRATRPTTRCGCKPYSIG